MVACVYCIVTLQVSDPQVEWLLPDRRIEVPNEYSLTAASTRLIGYTGTHPGRVLQFERAAKDMFDSYSVMFNTRVSIRRKNQDADSAAEEGVLAVRCHPLPSVAVCICTYMYTMSDHYM